MSQVVEKSKQENKEPLFGKKEKKLLNDPLFSDNPITVQVLGVCSALAVTTLVYPSIVMSIAVLFVVAFSNLIASLLRNLIPKQVRMIVQLVIIATLVSVVELLLKAFSFEVYKQLSVFIGLIVTNCIVMGRLEAFALGNKPWQAFIDGVGNALGYALVLIATAFVRELFGKGTLFAGSPIEMKIIGTNSEYLINTTESSLFSWYAPNNLMVLPAAALFIIGIMIWIQRTRDKSLVDVS